MNDTSWTFNNPEKTIIWLTEYEHIFYVGCSVSIQSHQIHRRVERKHAFLFIWLVKCVCGVLAIVYLTSAMQPVSYALFGYPLPQQWVLPIEIQYVSHVV